MNARKQREQEARDPVISQLQQTIESFLNSTEQLTSSITANVRAEVQHQIQMMVGKYVSWGDRTAPTLAYISLVDGRHGQRAIGEP